MTTDDHADLPTPLSIQAFGVTGLPEFDEGDDIAALILGRVESGCLGPPCFEDGDIVVVTSKIVSKVEGRIARAADREDAISAETVRVVATRRSTRIVETRHGFVMAAGGVDASNTRQGTVLLLPEDCDESSRRIRACLQHASGRRIGVIVSDTSGRPWRNGLVDVALGSAGLVTVIDYRGKDDAFGNSLEQTSTAVVDEIAAAADLVKGKLSGVPVAVVRGLGHLVVDDDGPGVRALIRSPEDDLFRLGTREAIEQGRREVRNGHID